MRRRYQGIPILLAVVCMAAGCGTEVPDGGQYVEAQGLNQALVSAIVPQKSPVTADESDDRVAELPQAEVTGSETETEKKVIRTVDVMSQAGGDAIRLGTVTEGEILSVIGDVEENGMLKVCYNGRIAHIPADALEPDPTPAPTPTPKPARRPSGGSGRPSGGGTAQSGGGNAAATAVPEGNGTSAEPTPTWVPEYAADGTWDPDEDSGAGGDNGGQEGNPGGDNQGGNSGGDSNPGGDNQGGNPGEGGNPGGDNQGGNPGEDVNPGGDNQGGNPGGGDNNPGGDGGSGEPPVEGGNEGGSAGEGPADPPVDEGGTVGDVSPDDYNSSTGEGVPSQE